MGDGPLARDHRDEPDDPEAGVHPAPHSELPPEAVTGSVEQRREGDPPSVPEYPLETPSEPGTSPEPTGDPGPGTPGEAGKPPAEGEGTDEGTSTSTPEPTEGEPTEGEGTTAAGEPTTEGGNDDPPQVHHPQHGGAPRGDSGSTRF